MTDNLLAIDAQIGQRLRAARNAAALHLADRAAFVCSNWADALHAQFGLILCNPPYIRSADIGTLMPEVAYHEPESALDGGPDGLRAYREVLPLLPHVLAPDGVAVLELGAGQAEAATEIAGWAELVSELRPDLAGIPRALLVHRRLP